jgi:hypothetical protein
MYFTAGVVVANYKPWGWLQVWKGMKYRKSITNSYVVQTECNVIIFYRF